MRSNEGQLLQTGKEGNCVSVLCLPSEWFKSKMAVGSPCYGIEYLYSMLEKDQLPQNHHSSATQSAFKELI